MNRKIAFTAAASVLFLSSAVLAQTTEPTTTTGTTGTSTTTGTTATTGAGTATADLPNVQGDLNSTLTVAPATTPMVTQPTTTTRSVTTGNTTTTTTVTVVPKPAPVAPTTGAGEMQTQQAGERG